MNPSQLKAFVSVVDAGGFSAAAQALGCDKAQVSRAIARAERDLGVRLLQRSTRALSLTEVGQRVYRHARTALAALDDIEACAEEAVRTPSGELRLTCGVEFGLSIVNGWARAYLERYPATSIQAEFTGRLVDLVHEGFDLAIRIGPLEDSSLVARELGRLRYGLYAHASYLALHGTPRHPRELAGHALLCFAGPPAREAWVVERDGERISVPARGRLSVNNAIALAAAAVDGLGIARLPCLLADGPSANGGLVRVLPEWRFATVPVHAVFPSNRQIVPKVRAFIDLARERFPPGAA